MRIVDDGHVAISIEIHGGTIRLHGAVEDGDSLPPIIGAGEFHEVTPEVVRLSGFAAGGMTARHMRLIGQEMLAMGYCWLIAKRLGAHKLPDAEAVTEWPFVGWQRVDLVKSRLCARGARRDKQDNKETPA